MPWFTTDDQLQPDDWMQFAINVLAATIEGPKPGQASKPAKFSGAGNSRLALK
jgi:hypothetical protein